MTMMAPPPNPSNSMAIDPPSSSYEETQSTQQPTQIASQEDKGIMDTHLWGFLIPCSANLRRIDFQKIKPSYRIGRNREEQKNDIILPGMNISESRDAFVLRVPGV